MATAPRQDIKLIENDIDVSTGDLLIVFSDMQHVEDTMNAYAGWWKENPLDGVGLQNFLSSPADDQVLKREIQIQLGNDGYGTSQISIDRTDKNTVIINPNAVLI